MHGFGACHCAFSYCPTLAGTLAVCVSVRIMDYFQLLIGQFQVGHKAQVTSDCLWQANPCMWIPQHCFPSCLDNYTSNSPISSKVLWSWVIYSPHHFSLILPTPIFCPFPWFCACSRVVLIVVMFLILFNSPCSHLTMVLIFLPFLLVFTILLLLLQSLLFKPYVHNK